MTDDSHDDGGENEADEDVVNLAWDEQQQQLCDIVTIIGKILTVVSCTASEATSEQPNSANATKRQSE